MHFETKDEEIGAESQSGSRDCLDSSHIDDLPEEMLLLIFEHLDQYSRRAVKNTCTKWQNTFLHSSRFAKYQQLTLDNNLLLVQDKEPVSLFMETQRKIGILKLGNVNFGINLEEFWKKMSSTVIHLKLTSFNWYSVRSQYLSEIIQKYFTKVHTLEVENFFIDRQDWGPNTKYIQPWISIRILKIGCVKLEFPYVDFIQKMMPNLKEIHFGRFECTDENILRQYAEKIKSVDMGDKANLLYRLTNCQEFKPEDIQIDLSNTTLFDSLTEFINAKPELRSVSVKARSFPRERIPKLLKLRLEFEEQIQSFEPLHEQRDLKELQVKLSNYDMNCFFGHDILRNANLECLYIYHVSSGDCKKCIKVMFKSFSNLKTFESESCFVSSVDVASLISKYLPKLENLSLKYFVTRNFCLNDCLLNWQTMPNLRTCYLNHAGTVSHLSLL